MEEGTGVAEVISVTKQPVVEIAEGVEVGGYTVRARIYAPTDKYSDGSFTVKIAKPQLQHAQGSQMEHGEFSFNSGEELKVGDKLGILIFSTKN
ncbi:MAG: hypothetical protein JO066_08215 [Verrucomicrobia bacterium]|nr:hypothetical protein [Verrucomicrobiota bacterium]MBV9298947.1 hypothetical protein [Verrucomicrobiota bacterium]MBV9642137.1 hypothetical protein [Verrucomicrobiota bacterium]